MTPWTAARQAPLSMGFSRQEYWSGLPCPPPGDLPDSGTELTSLLSLALAGGFFTTSAPWEAAARLDLNFGSEAAEPVDWWRSMGPHVPPKVLWTQARRSARTSIPASLVPWCPAWL